MKSNKNITALITGGSRGIGRAVCLALAESYNSTIFVNYLQNDDEAECTKKMAEELGAKVFLIKRNMAYTDEIDKMFDEIYKHSGSLDFFIHCAAINSFKPLSEIKPNQWDLVMNVNARSFLLCSQKCSQMMKTGVIVSISSLGSRMYVPNYGSMGATKSALESIVKYLAVEFSEKNIRVNGVTAGFVQTDSIQKFPEHEVMIEKAIERTPAKRIGSAKDISNIVMFLLSSDSEWIYGQNIVVDGGISLF
jgi:enoyl-[acyl-carrier protein] reductase III